MYIKLAGCKETVHEATRGWEIHRKQPAVMAVLQHDVWSPDFEQGNQVSHVRRGCIHCLDPGLHTRKVSQVAVTGPTGPGKSALRGLHMCD